MGVDDALLEKRQQLDLVWEWSATLPGSGPPPHELPAAPFPTVLSQTTRLEVVHAGVDAADAAVVNAGTPKARSPTIRVKVPVKLTRRPRWLARLCVELRCMVLLFFNR